MRSAALVLLLLIPACSGTSSTNTPPDTAVLCAAEALYQARQSGVPRAEEDVLRDKANLFTLKLTPEKREQVWRKIDEFADHRAAEPLVEPATCEALLTPSDRADLANPAGEADTHPALGNGQ